MSRHTIQVSVTVDVDDATPVQADQLRVIDMVPTAHEAMCSAIVDAIADHAAIPLHEQGIEFVVVELTEAERAISTQRFAGEACIVTVRDRSCPDPAGPVAFPRGAAGN